MDYVIITETTADLPLSLIKELDVRVLPLGYVVDGKEYGDEPSENDLMIKGFYRMLKEGKHSSTSQINSAVFEEVFEEYFKSGKDILYLAFSGALSGTVQQARVAADELKDKFPDRKIVIVDTLCASLGEGLLVYYTAKKRDSGASLTEAADYAETLKHKICHWFTVDDLNHLKRGGRVSPTAAAIGSMLGIKPILHVDEEGRLIPVSKVRGRSKSIEALIERAEKTIIPEENPVVFISHGDCREDAMILRQLVINRLGVKDVVVNYIGPTIGSHSGQGTLALFFVGSSR